MIVRDTFVFNRSCRHKSVRSLPSCISLRVCGWGHRLWLDLESGAASCKAQEIGGGGGGLRGKMQKDNRGFPLLSSATTVPTIGVGWFFDCNSLWPLLKSGSATRLENSKLIRFEPALNSIWEILFYYVPCVAFPSHFSWQEQPDPRFSPTL